MSTELSPIPPKRKLLGRALGLSLLSGVDDVTFKEDDGPAFTLKCETVDRLIVLESKLKLMGFVMLTSNDPFGSWKRTS
jgi:hypothetical protein